MSRRRGVGLVAAGAALMWTGAVFAEGPLDTPADIAWTIVAAALVFFMQAGFALLEGGMVRAKNAVNVIMKNYSDMCFGVIAYWAIGYGLMFGATENGWFGLDHYLPDLQSGVEATHFIFQLMFAATAATIVSGAVAERMRFGPYVVASMIITGVIYAVYGAWAWGSFYDGSGWLVDMGFIDFAGSTVVHSVGGWCALAGVIVLGPRLGRFAPDGTPRDIPGHNLPYIALGGFILWLGWFGFNGGSTLSASAEVGVICVNTHLAGAAGFIGALLMQRLLRKPILMTAAVNGAIGGLVAITSPCATTVPMFALVIGLVAGGITVLGVMLLERFRLDDVVGAVSVHGFCGAWGTLSAALFYRGDLFDLGRIQIQLIGIGAAFLWSFPTALLTFWIVKKVFGLRAPTLHEQRGLDFTEHYEIGYPEFQRDLTHAGKD